jgi:hypothetical protein
MFFFPEVSDFVAGKCSFGVPKNQARSHIVIDGKQVIFALEANGQLL